MARAVLSTKALQRWQQSRQSEFDWRAAAIERLDNLAQAIGNLLRGLAGRR